MVKKKEDFEKLKYYVGVAMRDNYDLRLHVNKRQLLEKIEELASRKVNMEAVFRCQRLLWENALNSMIEGNGNLFNNFIPYKKTDFEEWCKKRKEDPEKYKTLIRGTRPWDADNQIMIPGTLRAIEKKV